MPDLSTFLASLGLTPFQLVIATALLSVFGAWLKLKQPLPAVPNQPGTPTPVPGPPAPPMIDPLNGLPGLPGHPFLNGLLSILPFLRILTGGAAAVSAAGDARLYQSADALTSHDDAALTAIAQAVGASPAAKAKMLSLLK
ncbi:MAG: hypothetical protein K8T89_23235 [Planctomycetes bacterium]|nr:hypothetical protein [Planctomycetota bacterium]